MTFGTGPKVCPGEIMARMEIFMIFVNAIRRFKICPTQDGFPELVVFGILHAPKKYETIMTKRMDRIEYSNNLWKIQLSNNF